MPALWISGREDRGEPEKLLPEGREVAAGGRYSALRLSAAQATMAAATIAAAMAPVMACALAAWVWRVEFNHLRALMRGHASSAARTSDATPRT